MRTMLRPHLRLVILAGIAVGLAVVFLLASRSAEAPAVNKEIRTNQATNDPEPKQEFLFPSDTRQLLPDHRLVALYGTPDYPVLGSLGEQPFDQAIARIKNLAAEYQAFSEETIYPAFEIITTIAAAEPTSNGDYSREIDIERLRPWVDAAKLAGVYVVLDLQPGLTDFLTQAKIYEELLRQPHVGLALDPEWRLKPGQKHMKQIGSVSAIEIQQTADWLADLTAQHDLPQKLFLIHQFKLSMITDRQNLDTARPELAWSIQMDGLGAPHVKQDTWRNITAGAPEGIFFGWKNFYDEDSPMYTPEQTMGLISPAPWFVSYQ